MEGSLKNRCHAFQEIGIGNLCSCDCSSEGVGSDWRAKAASRAAESKRSRFGGSWRA